MIFERKNWFGGKKKEEPKAPEKTEQKQGQQTLTPEELKAARAKIDEEIDAQFDQLRSKISAATDPKMRQKLEEMLAERESQLQNKL